MRGGFSAWIAARSNASRRVGSDAGSVTQPPNVGNEDAGKAGGQSEQHAARIDDGPNFETNQHEQRTPPPPAVHAATGPRPAATRVKPTATPIWHFNGGGPAGAGMTRRPHRDRPARGNGAGRRPDRPPSAPRHQKLKLAPALKLRPTRPA